MQFLWPIFITIILINNKPYHSLTPSVPSSAPQNIRSLLLTSTSAEILWDPPPLEDQNGLIQNYTLLITEVDTDRSFNKVVENASITLQELQPLYTYQFVVAARTVVGLGPFSSRYSLQVPESGKYSGLLSCMIYRIAIYGAHVCILRVHIPVVLSVQLLELQSAILLWR